MQKVILFIASSLDGFIAGKDGDIEWLFTDADYGYSEFYHSIDTVIMGRKTYDQALKFGEYPYADKKGFVFSRSVERQNSHDIEFISGNVPGFIKNLKRQPGKGIWLVGGSEIITLLLNADLIDECILYVHPIILGEGTPLFQHISSSKRLSFVSSKDFQSGLIQLVYRKP